ncbi:hypothetical protein SC22_11295 [Bacillus sp. A053]|uniref:Uncharacterized protein n=1 Tax=Bacillus stercoris TaxID=2054641 RepID=A0ABU0V1W1_9BACI|nr:MULTISPECIES: hypothetical protein [Bacillus]AUS14142.1 hypothetical protein C0W65_20290 [Bacillus subtilis]AFI28641.1 hypothetical protein MY9_2107 [Bacillus sp. JS]ASB61209.1 hypothetical protein CDO84_09515 [Bacillus sp. MD-5]KIH39260.1 hypothetical protein SC22_11295 [Bacillus sp. A053]MCB7153228.1 hypothetical protein [Bacillus stercoris]
MLPTNINIAHLKTNTIGSGSSLTFGSAELRNKCSAIKRNNGFGEQNADFVVMVIPIESIDDRDGADALSMKINHQ